VITKLQWSHGRLNSAANFTKPEKNNKYFGFLKFKARGRQQTKQNLLDFLNTKPKIESKANQN
jgi:hypothetical protein